MTEINSFIDIRKMENRFKSLNNDEYKDTVLSFEVSMFKVSDLMKQVKQSLETKGLDILKSNLNSRGGIPGNTQDWYVQGVNCEILKPGNTSWKKGKVKINISLEFCPDEPEIEEIIQSNNTEINQSESPH